MARKLFDPASIETHHATGLSWPSGPDPALAALLHRLLPRVPEHLAAVVRRLDLDGQSQVESAGPRPDPAQSALAS